MPDVPIRLAREPAYLLGDVLRIFAATSRRARSAG